MLLLISATDMRSMTTEGKQGNEIQMEIGFIYSREDPKQREAREFVDTFCRERGILAKVIDRIKPVKSPTLIVNGQALTDRRRKPRERNPRMFPSIEDIARVLERHSWSL